jgi:hypothetical protein
MPPRKNAPGSALDKKADRAVHYSGIGNLEMESEKVGGILGAIVAAVVLAIAFAYGPMGPFGKPAKQLQTNQAPKAPPGPPPVRGPVVREVPQ